MGYVKRQSLVTKASMAMTLPVVLIAIWYAITFYTITRDRELENLRLRAKALARNIATSSLKQEIRIRYDEERLTDLSRTILYEDKSVIAISVMNTDGSIYFFMPRQGSGLEDWADAVALVNHDESLIATHPVLDFHPITSDRRSWAPDDAGLEDHIIANAGICMSLDETRALIAGIRNWCIAITCLVILATVLVMRLLARVTLRPIVQLARAAEAVAAGDLSQRVASEREDELGQLIASFNQMTRDLDAGMTRLHNTQEMLNNVLESSTEYGIIATDLKGEVLLVNAGARRLLNMRRSEVLHLSLEDCLVPLDCNPPSAPTLLEQLGAQDCVEVECELCYGAKQSFPAAITFTSFKNSEGKTVGIIALLRDMTAQKRLEFQLKEYNTSLERRVEERTRQLYSTKSYLEKIIHNAPVAIAVVDQSGEVQLANTVFAEILGTNTEELVGRNLIRWISGGSMAETLRAGLALPPGETLRQDKVKRQTATGQDQTLSVILTSLRTTNGAGNDLLIIADDVSERVRLESETMIYYRQLESAYKELRNAQEQLVQAGKMSAVGQLAGGVAHEFNNLLVGIRGYAELAASLDNAAEIKKCLSTILKSSDRARDITRNLLSFSRRSDHETEQADIQAVLEETLDLVQRQLDRSEVDLIRDFRSVPQLELVIGDIQQVFLNMVINAVQAMPHGGQLRIGTRQVGHEVLVEFADTGEGIKPENMPHIFEPFFTTKGAYGDGTQKGTGLGLSTSYRIVQDHHGHIDVASEPGQGTTFTVHLPLNLTQGATPAPVLEDDELPEGVIPSSPPGALAEDEPILVVDDEEIIRSLMQELISSMGITVVTAASGEEAVSLVRQQHFKMAFLDVMMPGISGVEALRRMREIDPRLIAIMVTGRANDDAIEEAMQLGARACVWKPFRIQEIIKHIQEAYVPSAQEVS